MSSEVGDRANQAVNFNNIASIYDDLQQKKKALEYYERSLSIRKELNDLYGISTNLNNIGFVYSSLNQYEKALEYYKHSLAITME
ncbi:tetratricopeptide repeat protein, partial [Synechocystis salina LEGE 06155]|nr:tetratricopeptide repeat protein [Synechocystis salina LEGE 06155]